MISGLVARLLLGSLVGALGMPSTGGRSDAGTQEAPTEVKVQVVPPEVQLGAPFSYEVELTHPTGMRYELGHLPPGGPFELMENNRERRDGAAQATTHFRVKAALFELGKHRFPDLTFEVTRVGHSGRWTLPGIEVTGLSSLPAEAAEKGAELLDIKPPEAVWIRSYRLLAWAALALAGIALLWLFVSWLRKRAGRPLPAPPPLPLDVRTLAALDKLAREELPAKGRTREFYFRLSEVLRTYVGERFRLDALECTTPELLHRLNQGSTPGLALPQLRAFLEEADLVKFAKAEAAFAACAAALQFGHQLVRETTPSVQASDVPGTDLPTA